LLPPAGSFTAYRIKLIADDVGFSESVPHDYQIALKVKHDNTAPFLVVGTSTSLGSGIIGMKY